MPLFWEYPLLPHDFPYYWFILDPKSKQNKVKVTNVKKLPKIKIFEFCKKLDKMLDKMCEYETGLVSIVEDTEWTRFHPQTDGQMERLTDGWMDRRTAWNQHNPFQLQWSRGMINHVATEKNVRNVLMNQENIIKQTVHTNVSWIRAMKLIISVNLCASCITAGRVYNWMKN